jgi:hypothetical protein
MTKEKKMEEKVEKKIEEAFCCKDNHKHRHGGHGDALYGLGVIGAMFYFLQSASGFNEVVIGICKAVFWPAILMFKLLTYLQL